MKLLAALATASALAAGQAQAGPLFDSFRTNCVGTQAKLEAVQAQAKRGGWMPMPQALLDQASRQFKPKAAEGWIKTDPQTMNMLLWAKAEVPGAAQIGDMRFCAVASMPPDGAAASEMKAWAGVPERKDFGGSDATAYVFVADPAGHKPLPEKVSDRAAKDFFANPLATLAMTQTSPQMTMLGVFMPDK